MIQFDKKNLNVPNALTVLRIILIAPFLYFFFTGNMVWALIMMGLSGLSDALDGFIARRYHQITPLGKLLDPLADKLTQTTIALCISIHVPLLIPVFAIFVIKEILMLIGACILLKRKKRPGAARWYGKTATILFYVSIASVLAVHVFFKDNPVLAVVSVFLLAVTAGFMIYAFVEYYKIFRALLQETRVPELNGVSEE